MPGTCLCAWKGTVWAIRNRPWLRYRIGLRYFCAKIRCQLAPRASLRRSYNYTALATKSQRGVGLGLRVDPPPIGNGAKELVSGDPPGVEIDAGQLRVVIQHALKVGETAQYV